ncbi:MAG: hypothetical protein HZC41_12565 [Chloroflexi bacterium]|nr:hypothetical protein [Chloroflexota bacterium]
MARRILVLSWLLLALVSAVAAQTIPPVQIGETVEVKADQTAPQLALTVSEPQVVTLIARGGDDSTDPYLSLLNAAGREVAYASDNMGGREDVAPYDAVIENFYLLPGEYAISVSGIYGDQVASLTVEAGDPGLIGLGQTEIVSGTVVENGRFRHSLQLEANEIVTISVVSLADTFNPYLELRNSMGVPVAVNDDRDYQFGDPVLNYGDSQIKYFVVPETDTYDIEVSSYSDTDHGDIQVFITRYGQLTPREGARLETFTGNLVPNGRLNFSSVMKRSEVVTITVRALEEGLDPRLSILNAQGVIMAENDDHGTTNPDLNYGDAQLRNLIIAEAGKYTLEITSYSGSGEVEVTVEHLGTFESSE